MNLSEAERQVLATLRGAELETQSTDQRSLEKRGERYWIFLEDWSNAFSSLIDKGLIDGDEGGYRLTAVGRRWGDTYHRERPDMYWYYYQRFYPAAHASAAHSRLCERVFGEDLCQEGMTDMVALKDLLARLDLRPGDHLLDLGCGAGVIAEYISDQTGAKVTGLDYAASAIAEANERTADKRSQLTFLQADLNALDLPAQSFDAAISLDSLYWVADLADTLSQVVRTIKPAGQIGIFMLQALKEGDPPEILEADKTALAQALSQLNLSYDAYDYTTQNAEFWRRNWEAATALRDDFEAEGNGFIAASLIREAEEEFLPAIKAGSLTRYLYHARL
ncbi:MAG: class I SAM-dependent methyltransferase [Alphaproteobacteria bacterium]